MISDRGTEGEQSCLMISRARKTLSSARHACEAIADILQLVIWYCAGPVWTRVILSPSLSLMRHP